MKKFKVATLGCRTNQYESQAYRDQLLAMGYHEAAEGEQADLCIVNTCTVTSSADSHSRQQIRRLLRENEGTQMVVTGCLAERRPDLIQKIGGVDLVVPNKQKEKLLEYVFPGEELPEFSIKNFEAHTRAFVKVQDGCNSFCTYCIIPYVRGRSRSRAEGEIVSEVEQLVSNGYKEVVVTGINVGDYDGGLAALMRRLDKIEGLSRLRLSSIDPDEVDADLLDAIVHGKNTCHCLHLVLQSGSNAVLKRMNRKYTRQIFLDTVKKLKEASADFTFTTDVIVGFPMESEEDFQETLAVIDEVQFAKVHMFPYSARERTKAATYPQLDPQIIAERKNILTMHAEQAAFALRERFVGRRMHVLTESKEGGYTGNFLPVKVSASRSNELIEVEIVENQPDGLVGVL